MHMKETFPIKVAEYSNASEFAWWVCVEKEAEDISSWYIKCTQHVRLYVPSIVKRALEINAENMQQSLQDPIVREMEAVHLGLDILKN